MRTYEYIRYNEIFVLPTDLRNDCTPTYNNCFFFFVRLIVIVFGPDPVRTANEDDDERYSEYA